MLNDVLIFDKLNPTRDYAVLQTCVPTTTYKLKKPYNRQRRVFPSKKSYTHVGFYKAFLGYRCPQMDCCVYCGDWYQCRDHVIPISYCQVSRDYKRNATVTACTECNSYLGRKAYHTVIERAMYLLERYPYKYRKLLALPEWTEEECLALGHNLRTGIRAKMTLKEVYALKIANLERVVDGYDVIPIEGKVPIVIRVMNTYLCEICDEEFRASRESRFCSMECRQDHIWRGMEAARLRRRQSEKEKRL